MTCIAVFRDRDGVVWMGADSSSMRDGTRARLAGGKMIDLGHGVYVGVAGKHYTSQVMRYGFTFTPPPQDGKVGHWMGETFVPELKRRFEEKGAWNPIERDGDPQGTESLIVCVVDGRIFEISSLCEPTEIAGDYHAIGSGEDVALGALYLSQRVAYREPLDILGLTLAAAAFHRENIAPPFHYMRCSPEP